MGLDERTRWKGGRGVAKWSFSLKDLAATVGLTPASVRKMVHAGEVDPSDLSSLTAFVAKRSGELERQVIKAVLAAGGDMGKAAAALGCSRSTLYRRAKEGT